MALLGVIGGLGPMATAYFMELLTTMTDADKDQEHLKMIVYSAPDIPDRTEYILGKSNDSPLPGFVEAGRALRSMGVRLLAIPCITAHYFHNEIEAEIGVKTLHAINESAELLCAAGVQCVGLMATDGTIQSGLFQKALEEKGIGVILPSFEGQRRVMSLIYDDVKQGRAPNMAAFDQVKDELQNRGAQIILLGCTELSVIKRDHELGEGILDVMEVLASAAITACGKRVRAEYKQLVPFYTQLS